MELLSRNSASPGVTGEDDEKKQLDSKQTDCMTRKFNMHHATYGGCLQHEVVEGPGAETAAAEMVEAEFSEP